jgi:hypothetical protein
MGRLGSFMAKMALTIALTGSAALLLADCGGSASAPSSTQSTPSSDAVSASSGSATTRTRAASASSNPTSGAQSAITASGGGPPCWFTASEASEIVGVPIGTGQVDSVPDQLQCTYLQTTPASQPVGLSVVQTVQATSPCSTNSSPGAPVTTVAGGCISNEGGQVLLFAGTLEVSLQILNQGLLPSGASGATGRLVQGAQAIAVAMGAGSSSETTTPGSPVPGVSAQNP